MQISDILKGILISLLYTGIMPVIYAVLLKMAPSLVITVLVSTIFFTIIGLFFGKYATYDKKRFENLAIGIYLGLVIGTSIMSRQLELLSGIYQAFLVYFGCILGEKLKASP